MATSFDTILKCTIGGASFQLSDNKWDEEPIKKDGRQIGRRVSVRGEGWLEAADHSALATAMRAAESSFRAGGKDLVITAPNNVALQSLKAADCIDGGPYFAFTVEKGGDDAWGARHVTFVAEGQTTNDPNGGGQSQPTTQRSITTSSDGLRGFSWQGDLNGVDVAKQFTTLLQAFNDAFPLPDFVVSHEFTSNEQGDKGSYRLQATELVDALPGNSTGYAVDGSASFTRDRDDQNRLTKTYSFDLVVEGAVDQVLDIIRPEGLILRESVAVGYYRKRTVRATFVTLEGGDASALMNWQASFNYEPPDPLYEIHPYSGAAPLLVQKPLGIGRLVYSGSMVGAGIFIEAPARPRGLKLLEPPQIRKTRVNAVEFRTDWQYVWVFEQDKLDPMAYMLLPGGGGEIPQSPLDASKPTHPPLASI